METLPHELIFLIAQHLHSPKDLRSFSEVSSVFNAVSRDERLWKRLCSRLYRCEVKTTSYYNLFTKILVPYGHYLGYWKSNQRCFGGLIYVEYNSTDEKISGVKIDPNVVFVDNEEQDDHMNEDSSIVSNFIRTLIFTIDTQSNQIFCHECNQRHDELQWTKTVDVDQIHFGLSQELLPMEERYSLISRDSIETDPPDVHDIFFIKRCPTNELSIVYRPLSIPKPIMGNQSHALNGFNGIWVGSYGGHGLELLHLCYVPQFECPITADGLAEEVKLVSDALIARKISGDPNVPHGQISFAAVRPHESESDVGKYYEGIGQIARTGYLEPQFIRTKIHLISENFLKVTWYALHHTSSFKRCKF